ncbi:DNA polymerase III subunit alpha [Nonlabens sp. YIK11]|uniref:DNA polymerase III subunit alpha n=1 Tax=Nonlabens sp. YIK11 TaxID=1453349 RepID=UPI0006DCC1BD|nr:DNA polymerase III subunit alpha [Nonlabens sp. YIK11]KQC32009.1 DNA polymerase III subunit alpha [Nonlabens sp. YIK11]
MYLIFDTETTGLPKRWDAPYTDVDNWPRVVQIAWQLHDDMGNMVDHQDYLIQPDGYDIPYDSERIHGISTALAQKEGKPLLEVLEKFNDALAMTNFVVGQNLQFDLNVTGAEFIRAQMENNLQEIPVLDTCTEHTAQLCQIPGGRGGKFKLPTLTELHEFLFKEPFGEAHNATADVEATTRCFFELVRLQQYTVAQLKQDADYLVRFRESNPTTIQPAGIPHTNLKEASARLVSNDEPEISKAEIKENLDELSSAPFAHLHNHSQFSILQSTASVQDLVQAAAANDMPAVAMTDHANMMGAFHFVRAVKAHNASLAGDADTHLKPIKPIIGCEFQVCEDMNDKSVKDNGYQIVMLAKNKNGYHNLAKMASKAYTEGFYYVPRIDKKLVEQYKDDLIVLTGNLYGEVPSKILNVGEKQAEEALLWWKEHFGEDLYIEIMRHDQEDEQRCNQVLLELASKHEVKIVATNNTYYIDKADANAHDILLCVKDNEKQATPIGRGRGYRYGLPNQEYYFKSSDEMKQLFKDLPDAILNVQEVIDKVEAYELARDVLLPAFQIPEEFVDPDDAINKTKNGENAYLRHLTYEGAKLRYGEDFSDEIRERLDFELEVIKNTGYPGYFLITWDFIKAAREMDVAVGPGRGSAAGSAVAYCLKITNVDPIHYDLLFERFLNPDRVSMPDIDIDFDDENRYKVMDYVIEKYGASQVAQIITYGTMAAKSSIRDCARALDLPLQDADRVAKLIPDFAKLKKIFALEDNEISGKFRGDDADMVRELRELAEGDDPVGEMLKQARILEGSVRNTGVHACGVIITPDDLTNFVPVATAKNSDLYVTQFDNEVVESAGLLKMDFLGLKTLSQIKDTVAIIKERHGISLDIESIPLDDDKTYELFQRGETTAIFQYESVGMQKYMRELKPTQFADLIAMNALYRPGPLEYIPEFIDRKHGRKEISYDLDAMEEYLKETYGITVYQEQVMLLSQKLANFSKGDADVLRKAMGKKQMATLQKMKPQFLDAGESNGHDRTILEKVWKDWEAFASYAFNKSHSTCYAWIAYQTAYLKANYPAEFMAATLSNNMNQIKDVTKFMDECRRMGLEVLGPDVNESNYKFTVNPKGAIRFGMGAVKGLGYNAVMTIIENRSEKPYISIFDMAKRIDLRAANKKSFEALALSGGFDGLGGDNRAQYFHEADNGQMFLEQVVKYAQKFQENENSAQVSLFGESSDVQIPEPQLPVCEDWGTMEKLKREKEVVGIYISGHPLDDYKKEIDFFCNSNLSVLTDLESLVNKELSFCGVISECRHLVSKANKPFGSFVLEDYNDSYEFRLFGEEYLKFRHFLVPNTFLYAKIKIQQGWMDKNTGKPRDPRIQFTHMQQLQDVMATSAKSLIIEFHVTELMEKRVELLKEVLEKHKGDHKLHFNLKDHEEKISLDMSSRLHKVNVNAELLSMLDEAEISYGVKG